jgi:hypothetical protein
MSGVAAGDGDGQRHRDEQYLARFTSVPARFVGRSIRALARRHPFGHRRAFFVDDNLSLTDDERVAVGCRRQSRGV